MSEDGPFTDRRVAAGVVELTGLFALGLADPIATVDAYLARIVAFNPELNAFLDLDEEGAIAAARASAARWAAGAPRSVLDGVPFGVKANIAVRGLPWHGGIEAYRDRRADRDAACVAALREAGAVILGTLNLHEAALGATTDNAVFGRCENPYRAGFTPGGSSGGSAAAVAAGLCAAALGTDTLGSVRIPAAYCGVFGLMPRRGAVSTAGIMPLSRTLDTVGLLARSTADLQAGLEVLGPDAAGVRPRAGGRSRYGVLDLEGRVELAPDVARAFAAVTASAQAAGLTLERVELADWDVGAARRLGLLIAEVEALAEHETQLALNPDGFSPPLKAMLAWAASLPAAKVAHAYRRLAASARAITDALSPFEAVLTPTTPGTAFSFDSAPPSDQPDFSLLANIAGWPAVAFPLGLSREGLPLSAQVIGRSEAACLALAARLARPAPPPARFRD